MQCIFAEEEKIVKIGRTFFNTHTDLKKKQKKLTLLE